MCFKKCVQFRQQKSPSRTISEGLCFVYRRIKLLTKKSFPPASVHAATHHHTHYPVFIFHFFLLFINLSSPFSITLTGIKLFFATLSPVEGRTKKEGFPI